MRRVAAAVAVGFAALALAGACTDEEPRTPAGGSDPSLTVATASGDVLGRDRGRVRSWRGIPYAAPPVGDLRWVAPRPPARWTGVRPAAEYGAPCLQEHGTAMTDRYFPGIDEPAEDCLTLNVHRPDDATVNLPVLVWIHGGAFTHGSGAQPIYNSPALVERGVVLVTLNYRLGRLGFFAHPALHGDEVTGPRYANFGILDQVAALGWVRENVAAFGGDPANVTIFGESAGGVSVNALMSSPESDGLFARAITQSGLGREPGQSWESAQAAGQRFADGIGLDDPTADDLRNLTAAKLMDPPINLLSGDVPVRDDLLPTTVEQAFAEGAESAVPYLVGSTDLEFSQAALADLGLDTEAVRGRIIGEGAGLAAAIDAYGSVEELDRHLVSDAVFTEPARRLARLHSDDATTYRYRFAVAPPTVAASGGAPHASEIPYVFDSTEGQPLSFESSEALADVICDLWVDFARDGIVEGWTTAETGDLVTFTNEGPIVGPDPWEARLDMVESAG